MPLDLHGRQSVLDVVTLQAPPRIYDKIDKLMNNVCLLRSLAMNNSIYHRCVVAVACCGCWPAGVIEDLSTPLSRTRAATLATDTGSEVTAETRSSNCAWATCSMEGDSSHNDRSHRPTIRAVWARGVYEIATTTYLSHTTVQAVVMLTTVLIGNGEFWTTSKVRLHIRYAALRSAACVEQVTAALRCALLPVASTNNVIG